MMMDDFSAPWFGADILFSHTGHPSHGEIALLGINLCSHQCFPFGTLMSYSLLLNWYIFLAYSSITNFPMLICVPFSFSTCTKYNPVGCMPDTSNTVFPLKCLLITFFPNISVIATS